MFAPRNSSPPLSQFTNSDDMAAHQVTSENAREIGVRRIFTDLWTRFRPLTTGSGKKLSETEPKHVPT